MSQGFSEARLDPRISRDAQVRIRRRTQVVELENSDEERVSKWRNSRRVFNIGYAAKDPDVLREIQAFFEARGGRATGFRFKDWMDYKTSARVAAPAATDELLGIGDGTARTAQLVRRYASGLQCYTREIRKPRPDVLIAVDGVPTDAWSIDYSTGLVTFDAPLAEGARATWGGEFDVPVRFAQDELDIQMRGDTIATVPAIEVVEDPLYRSAAEEIGLLFLNLGNPLAALVNVDLPDIFAPAP